MKIAGFEKMSLVDYDGKVCSTIFTVGCNFACPFCHNSPLVKNHSALPLVNEDKVLDYLNKRKGILDAVCISGGEPTLQKDLLSFMEKVKNLGYLIKLDTNGTNPELIKSAFSNGLCDYFAMDIKNDRESYAKICGFSSLDTTKVDESVQFFLSGKADYEFRTTLIDQFHDENNVKKIAKWIKGAKKYFLQKFKDSGSCIESGLSEVSKEKVALFMDILKKEIEFVQVRGYEL